MTIEFDESQLKRLEDVVKSITAVVNAAQVAFRPPEDPDGVTIRVPLGVASSTTPIEPFRLSLTGPQSLTLQQIMVGLNAQCPAGVRGRYPAMDPQIAVRMLLELVVEQVAVDSVKGESQ